MNVDAINQQIAELRRAVVLLNQCGFYLRSLIEAREAAVIAACKHRNVCRHSYWDCDRTHRWIQCDVCKQVLDSIPEGASVRVESDPPVSQ